MAEGSNDPRVAIAERDARLRELLAAAALHDRKALAGLYQMTSPKLYGVILRILSKEEWAQDCLQEVYIKVWKRADSYRPQFAAPLTWMSAIARNQALDLLRRRREVNASDVSHYPEEVDPGLTPQDALQSSDEAKRLNQCLKELQSAQRQIIALAYFKGLTHEELAAQTGTPMGTVKTWIRRGLAHLKRCLES